MLVIKVAKFYFPPETFATFFYKWENERMGEWENERMGEWENERMRECLVSFAGQDIELFIIIS